MTTAFRAVVMLAVLVGLPGAWIYYGPLPEGAQRVVDRVVTVAKDALGWASGERQAAKPAWSEAPPAPPWSKSPSTAPNVGLTAARTSAPTEVSAAGAPTFAQRVEPLLATLRQFGAAEYAMERWGARGELYRFRCEMPLAASEEFTQQFEAVAADPQATVEQVVAEVTSWRLARQGEEVLRQ